VSKREPQMDTQQVKTLVNLVSRPTSRLEMAKRKRSLHHKTPASPSIFKGQRSSLLSRDLQANLREKTLPLEPKTQA